MTLPPVPDTFAWTAERWGPALRCRPLAAVAPHLFSARQLELTSADDRRDLAVAVGGATPRARDVAMLTQVHGRGVVVVGPDAQAWAARPEGDVLVSGVPGPVLAVRAADCVPLLIADRETGAVAAVHAGWRGTVASAAVAAVEALGREYGARPEDLVAAIGPCIGSCCYEVGTELVDAFAAAGHARHLIDRWFISTPPPRGSRARAGLRLDVAGANRDQLVLAGLLAENVHTAGLCTAMHLDVLTSYRAEKDRAGRLAGAITVGA